MPAHLSNENLVRRVNKVIGNITTPLPKIGNSCVFKKYRTISVILHPGTVMFRGMPNSTEIEKLGIKIGGTLVPVYVLCVELQE